ncbi:MAG: 1,4-dihydroxy-2-naphthoate octaprenyltransferase [Rhodobacterales bacterium]|nr:MAG: 1,4-dihydroxy-2-naphthoate octaprenyltransferase [Rhodobacterales bacterium]
MTQHRRPEITLGPGGPPDPGAVAALRARLRGKSRPALFALAARFRTLSLSQVPVLAAGWLAAEAGQFRPGVTLAAMLGAGAIQIGTNLWNDAADAASGVDSPDRLGPPRMVALGLLGAAEVKRAALASFALAALAGLALVLTGGWPVVAIGLVSLLLGYAYSMGPRPLSGLPFGELLVIGFFGLVAVSTTAWLQGINPLAPRTLLLGLATGFPAAAVLMLNNHRDRVQDARAGRRTLAIVIGEAAARAVYAAALAAGLACAFAVSPTPWLGLPAALGLWLAADMARLPVSPRLNALLGRTALFQMALLLALVLG